MRNIPCQSNCENTSVRTLCKFITSIRILLNAENTSSLSRFLIIPKLCSIYFIFLSKIVNIWIKRYKKKKNINVASKHLLNYIPSFEKLKISRLKKLILPSPSSNSTRMFFFSLFFEDIDKRRRISGWKKRRGGGGLSSSFFLTVIPAYTSCQLSRIIALTITRRFYCELSKLIARVIAFAAEVPPREIKARRFKRVHIAPLIFTPVHFGIPWNFPDFLLFSDSRRTFLAFYGLSRNF